MSQYITKKLSNSAKKKRTDSKKKQEKMLYLITENATLRNIVNNIPGNVFWLNQDGVYLGCNMAMAASIGFRSTDEIVGKRNEDFIENKKIAHAIDQTNQEIMASGQEYYIEETGADVGGQPAVYLSKKAILYNLKGNPAGIIGISFNITDRKIMEKELRIAKEKAEASDQAKTQFLAMMNHELNTPLASIIGLINLIKHGSLSNQEENNIIDTIENCTEHLLDLVNEVLDFSRLENSNRIVRKNTVDIKEVVTELHDLLQITANNKGIELEIRFQHEIDKAILTDRRILLQILINLVNNAIKFTDKGKVVLEVKSNLREPKHMKLEIAVSDTGCGIPADKVDFIFEPFKQLDHHYTRQSSRHGTGLGLAIVKKLLTQLGMEIIVTSTQGLGSTFTIKGEFETTENKSTKSPLPLSKTRSSPTKKITKPVTAEFRVLLVEDDPIIQFIHKKMLEEYKCEIDIAPNGREAINMFNQHDIVFVDLTLPDISGFEVIKAIKKLGNSPIVALTAHTGEIERRGSLKAGANKFESKPISRDKLRKILGYYLNKK